MTLRIPVLLALAAFVAIGSGCNGAFKNIGNYNQNPGDFVATTWRNHVWARRAYEVRFGGQDGDQFHSSDYRGGFIAGYIAVCNGDTGELPTMPPKRYWASRYQSPDGQQKSQAWFRGYPEGVNAARQDGISSYRDIVISQLLEDVHRTQEQLEEAKRFAKEALRDDFEDGEAPSGEMAPGQPTPAPAAQPKNEELPKVPTIKVSAPRTGLTKIPAFFSGLSRQSEAKAPATTRSGSLFGFGAPSAGTGVVNGPAVSTKEAK